MPIDPRVQVLEPQHGYRTDTRESLNHARIQAEERGLDDYFIVDVDSHREPTPSWNEIGEYIENPVMRSHFQSRMESRGAPQYVNASFATGHNFQDMFGRVPHQGGQNEGVDDDSVHRGIILCRRAMEAVG